jgi:Cu-Zn family superoxide dismutase
MNSMPTKKPHGLLNVDGGPDFGDLPNLYVAADGTAHAEAFTQLTRFADLTDADGSAIVIHANPDDHRTQPIGGAGARVGCGVIK